MKPKKLVLHHNILTWKTQKILPRYRCASIPLVFVHIKKANVFLFVDNMSLPFKPSLTLFPCFYLRSNININDVLGNYSLTLIDTLDTLLVSHTATHTVLMSHKVLFPGFYRERLKLRMHIHIYLHHLTSCLIMAFGEVLTHNMILEGSVVQHPVSLFVGAKMISVPVIYCTGCFQQLTVSEVLSKKFPSLMVKIELEQST